MTSDDPEFRPLLSEFTDFLDCDPADFNWVAYIDLLNRIFPIACTFASDMSDPPQHLRPWGNSRGEYPWIPEHLPALPRIDDNNDNMSSQSHVVPSSTVQVPISYARTPDEHPEHVESQPNNGPGGQTSVAQPQSMIPNIVPFVDLHGGHPVLPTPTPSVHSQPSSMSASSAQPTSFHQMLPPIGPPLPANLPVLAGYPDATLGRQTFLPTLPFSSGHTRTGSDASLYPTTLASSIISTSSSSEPPPHTPDAPSASSSMRDPKFGVALPSITDPSYGSYVPGTSTLPLWTIPARAPSPPIHDVALSRRSPSPSRLVLATVDLPVIVPAGPSAPDLSLDADGSDLYVDRSSVPISGMTFKKGADLYVNKAEHLKERKNFRLWEEVSMTTFLFRTGGSREWYRQASIPGQTKANHQLIFDRVSRADIQHLCENVESLQAQRNIKLERFQGNSGLFASMDEM
ncbi:hypothetical protein FRC10_002084 [Ceratobasidium sp. 414]|nr:hypothetical protein FRC10_002084 [Ceratobasidium sp. 414]